MHSDSARRTPRLALAVFAAAVATIGACAFGVSPASGSTTSPASPATPAADLTLKLTPSSGSNFATDTATLSWSPLASACVGQEVDAFLYKGTGLWDATAINTAEGNNGGQQTYYNFFSNTSATSATISTSWPNESGGYFLLGFSNAVQFQTTADLFSSLGTGLYTLSVACVSNSTFMPILDGSGNPVADSILLDIGATGNSWKISPAISTGLTLTGSGTASPSGSGTANLTADVRATSGGSTPAGGVNFYAGGSATGTPLNGSTPVAVGSNGQAKFSGPSGYGANIFGAQNYTAQFVPTNPLAFVGSSKTTSVNLILDNVTITVTAKQDQASATSVDVKATATGSPLNDLSKLIKQGGVELVADGKVVSSGANNTPVLFFFDKSDVATGKVTGVKAGSHTFSALLATGISARPDVLGPPEGFNVTSSTAHLSTAGFATMSTLAAVIASNGLQLTATVKSPSGVTATPAGTVAFKDGSTSLGSATLTATTHGTATATVTDFSVPAGVNHFKVTFTPKSTAQFTGSAGTLDKTFPKAMKWVRPGSPVISGKAAVGGTLTAEPGKWGPAGVRLSFQWLANGAAISHATGATLVLGTAEFGKRITVRVTGHKTGFVTVSATSPATAKVTKGTLKSSRPKITGTAKVGDTLKVSVGSWTVGTSFRFQWLANGKPIGRATHSSLKLTSAQRGKRISVRVTGSKTDYNSVTKTSAQTGAVAR